MSFSAAIRPTYSASGPSGQSEPAASLRAARSPARVEPVEIHAERHVDHVLDPGALQLAGHRAAGRDRRLDQAAEPAHVSPGQRAGVEPGPAGGVRPRRDDAGKVAVIEPDRRHIQAAPGQVHQPRRAPRAPHLDQIGPLVRDDAGGGPGGEHEAVGLLGRDRRSMEPVAAHPARLEDLVSRAGHDQHLPQRGIALHVLRLLQQIGPHSAGRLAEELGDVEHAHRGGRPEPWRQLDVRDVERRRRGPRDGLEIEYPRRRPLSQSSPPGGRPCGSWDRDSCSRRDGMGRGSRSAGS